jgi:hypothetical protein
MSHPERWKGFVPLPDDIEARVAALQPWFVARGIDLAYLFQMNLKPDVILQLR